jgi:peptidoglycan-associated lipoprotein
MAAVLFLTIPLFFSMTACGPKKVAQDPTLQEVEKQQQQEGRDAEAGLTKAERERRERARMEAEQKERERREAEYRAQQERLRKEREERMRQQRGVMTEERFENEHIHFSFDSAVLTNEAQDILIEKAAWLKENPGITVLIEGHCDERGTNEYNMALGERRAKSAKAFLIHLGISSNRLDTISYGEERPLDPRQNEEAWAKNRRDQFVIQ